MANFATHIGAGTVVSGALATLTLAADVVAPENLVAVTLAGVVGSILPDIDLKDSRPSRALFSGLATFFSFCVLFMNAERYSIAELWIVWLGTFVAVRYGGEMLFHRLSYHRGIFHSILAGLAFWFITAIVFKYVLGRHEGVAWLAGGFLFIGFITHLILDELYSVDVMDTRIKQSFGTALKLFDAKHPGQSAAMALVCGAAFLMTPPATVFTSGISSPQLWSGLRERLLPQEHWFGIDASKIAALKSLVAAPQRPAVSDIATGSLPEKTETAPATPAAPAQGAPSAETKPAQ